MQRMTVCPNVHNAYDHWGKLFKAVCRTGGFKNKPGENFDVGCVQPPSGGGHSKWRNHWQSL